MSFLLKLDFGFIKPLLIPLKFIESYIFTANLGNPYLNIFIIIQFQKKYDNNC